MKDDNKFLPKKKRIKIFLSYQIFIFIVSLTLYHNILAAILFSFITIILYRKALKDEEKKIKSNITKEFKEFLNILSIAVATGDEPVKGFKLSAEEYINSNKNTIFIDALSKAYNYILVYNDLINGIKILSQELDIDVINKFYDSLNVAYESYGNVNDILTNTVDLITEKIETKNEIENIFYEKKYELKIMLLVPILIYLFLTFTAKEFIKPIYESFTGYFVITICLCLLILAYYLGEKILDCDVE